MFAKRNNENSHLPYPLFPRSKYPHSHDKEGPYMFYQGLKLRAKDVGFRYSYPQYQGIAPENMLNKELERMSHEQFEFYLGLTIPDFFLPFKHEEDPVFNSVDFASMEMGLHQSDFIDAFDKSISVNGFPIYRPPSKYWAIKKNNTFYVLNRFDACGYVGFDYLHEKSDLQQRINKKLHCVPFFEEEMMFEFDDYMWRAKINSPYHIIAINSYDKMVYVQMTDRDVYELSHANPNFNSLISLYDGDSKWFAKVNHSIEFSENWNGFIFWNSLFYDFYYSPLIMPRNNDFLRQVLYTHYNGRLDKKRKVKNTLSKPENIIIQSLFDMFVYGQSKPPGLIQSVQEIGKFAQTANNVKAKCEDLLNIGWIQQIIQSLTSLTGFISQITNDFVQFCKDPIGYCSRIKRDFYSNLVLPSLGVFDTSKIALLLGLSFYLFSKSQLLSLGLFMYAINSLIASCMTDSQIVRQCTVIVTFCFIGIMKALQPTPASIEIQSIPNLKAIIFTCASFVTICFASKGYNSNQASIVNHLAKNTRDLFNLSKGTLSLVSCIEFVIHTFNLAFEYVFGDSIFYRTLVKMTVSSKDLQEYISYALVTSPESLSAKLTMDEAALSTWERMCKLHVDFVQFFSSGKPPTETHIGYSMYSKAYIAFNKLKDEYEKVKDSLTYFRTEPFMIWIWGEPGTGKTFIRDQIINNIYRWHLKIDPTIPDIKSTGLIYVRNPADKYMSKYNGQFAVAYDDVGQNRQADNPEFNEIMGFGSTNQVRINMADLNDKGKMFSSKLVVMAANSQDVESNNLILKNEAFNRRRHIVVKIERPKSNDPGISTSQCDFNKVALILTNPHSGAQILRLPREGFGENDVVWTAFYKWLGPHYKNHIVSQTEALKKKREALEAVIKGQDHPSLVDLEDIPETPSLNITFGDFTQDLQLQGGNDDWYNDWLDNPYSGTLSRPSHCDNIFKKITFLRSTQPEFDAVCVNVLDAIPYGDDDPKSSIAWMSFFGSCKKWIGRVPTQKEIDILKSIRSCTTYEDLQASPIEELFESVASYSPGWVKLAALVGSGVALVGLYKVASSFFGGKDNFLDIDSYSLNTQAPPSKQVVVQSYSLETKAPSSKEVVIQSSNSNFFSDKTTQFEDVVKVYKRNFARFSHLLCEGVTFQHVNAINVSMTAWLVPYHFVLDLDEFCVLVKRDNQPPMQVTIKRNDIVQIDNTDLCLIHIPLLQHGRNIINHFANRDQLASVRNFDGSVLSWDVPCGNTSLSHTGLATRWDVPLEVNHMGKTLYYPRGYNYNWMSRSGDCGSLLLSKENTCVSKIMGVHFGYDSYLKVAKSVIVSRESLEAHLLKVVPLVERINATSPDVEVQSSPVPSELMKEGKPIFEYFGTVKDGPLPPRTHKDLFRSPLFDVVYPHEKDLSVLSKNDKRMAEEYQGDPDILTRGVVDFAYESRPWPSKELKIAQEALFGQISQFREVIPRKVCSLDWALNGTWIGSQRLEHTEALNLKTSAGYGLDGKKIRHFTTHEENGKVTHTISNPKLQQMVDEQWNDWMEGNTHPTIWAHALKSEPIKLSKIVNGNTRTFCVAQTAFLINVRRLFGAFTVGMKNSKIRSFSCLGMDSFSGDWNVLYDELRKVGPTGIDMDFFKYDRTAVTWQLARAVVEVINRWYNDDIVYQRARIIAFEDLIFSYALIGKHLTRKVRGNPSGNPLTTELNNCVNYLMLVMVYLLVAKENDPPSYSIRSFEQNISCKTYGDDIVFSVSPDCTKWFDVRKIEEIYKFFGVPVTPADKSDAGLSYRPINELTFLKCEFLPFKHPIYKWQAGLSKTSIRNMVQFYRLKPGNGTVEEACRTNCEDSLRFAYHWGPEFFSDHLEKLNKRFKELNWPLIMATYEEYDFIYRSKLA